MFTALVLASLAALGPPEVTLGAFSLTASSASPAPPPPVLVELRRPWEKPPPPPPPPPPEPDRLVSRGGEIAMVAIGMTAAILGAAFIPASLDCKAYLDANMERPCGIRVPPPWADYVMIGTGLSLAIGGAIPLIIDERRRAHARKLPSPN